MLIKISFKYSSFIKIAKFQLNHFNRLVINMNGKKNLGLGGGCCNCYIIFRGGGFQKCYRVLYRVGGGQKFPIFALYNMCTIPSIVVTLSDCESLILKWVPIFFKGQSLITAYPSLDFSGVVHRLQSS